MKFEKSTAIFFSVILISSLTSFFILQTQTSNSNQVFLSTSTSIENTGLLDLLITEYEKLSDYIIKYTAVGSGAAIQLAIDGEVDGVISHAPNLELDLLDQGIANNREILWYNYFIIIGPSNDPANISNSKTISEVFQKLEETGMNGQSNFYSRGDSSGTHQKELSIWSDLNITIPNNSDWYYETGTGMSSTIITTNNDEKGYTISDIGTYAKLISNNVLTSMNILYENDNNLFNPYSFLTLNPEKTSSSLNIEGTNDFLNFLKSKQCQDLVRSFKISSFQLFIPISDYNDTSIFS